jgi:hypothetical protein
LRAATERSVALGRHIHAITEIEQPQLGFRRIERRSGTGVKLFSIIPEQAHRVSSRDLNNLVRFNLMKLAPA